MTLPMQQAWLKRLEVRAARAAVMRFDADEAKRQEAAVYAQLHQKTITWQVLRAVIDQVDTWEKGVIDQLVRQYGNLVFDTFHKQIDVYNQRRQAWLDVYSEWEHAGKPFDQRDRLIDWLQAAIRSAAPGSKEPIPERPKFVSEQPAAPAETAPPTRPPAVAKPQGAPGGGQASPATAMPTPPTETAKPSAASGGTEPPQKAKQEGEKSTTKSATNPPAEPAKPPAAPGAGGSPQQPKSESEKPPEKAPAKRPAETAKPQAAAAPGAPPTARAAAGRAIEDADRELARMAPARAAEPPLAAPRPIATAQEPTMADRSWRRRSGGDEADGATVGPPAIAARRAAEPQAIGGVSVQLPSRQPMAVAVSVPRVAQPVPPPVVAAASPRQEPSKSPALHAAAVETMTAVSSEAPAAVEVEPEELVARIRGCNLALRALEVELDEKGAWTAARLEPLVKRLERLALRRHDLQLFREVVPPQERSGLETLDSTKSVVSPLAVHIVEARSWASGAAFKGSGEDRERELRRLNELSHRLAAVAEK
jgi:hypothetical protein